MLVVCFILAIQTYWDIRYKEIPTVVTVCGSVIGILYCLLMERPPLDIVEALLAGLLLLLIGKITKEAVGYGDGLLVGMMGFFYSKESVWSICVLAFFIAGIVGMVLLVVFRKKGTYQLPFVPFLFVANLVCLIGERGM